MAFYLTKLDQDSKKIIFNEKYKDVFAKYQLALEGADDTSFLLDGKPKPISSGGGSPVGNNEENYNYFEGNSRNSEGSRRRKFFSWNENSREEEDFENQDFYSPSKQGKKNLSPLANKESDPKKKTTEYLFDLQEDDSEENKKEEFINIQLE